MKKIDIIIYYKNKLKNPRLNLKYFLKTRSSIYDLLKTKGVETLFTIRIDDQYLKDNE